MFNSVQTDLYQRLQDFELDDQTHEFGFTRHLIKNHGWTLIQTQRAICEYKKFAFLAIVADHQVVPSDRVDQVWHAHVLLTQSYWEEFCPKVLGQKLHHHPARGGKEERAEFHILYAKTIASYRHFFGSPPTDIWSSPDRRFDAELKMQRINFSEHWVIPKKIPQQHIRKVLIALTIVTSIAIGSVKSVQAANLKMVLSDYVIQPSMIFTLSIMLGIGLRYWIQMPGKKAQKPQLDIYQIARLAGGESRAIELAIVKLVEQGYLRPNVLHRTLGIEKSLPAGANKLEQQVMFQARITPSLEKIQLPTRYKGKILLLEKQLKDEQLFMTDWQDAIGKSFTKFLYLTFSLVTLLILFCSMLSLFDFMLPLVSPFLSIIISYEVGTTISISWFVTGIVTYCCFVPSGRTRWGNRTLADIRKKHDIYDASQRFALDGYQTLSGGALDDLKQIYQDRQKAEAEAGGCGCGC